jgi:hypothetical protein
MGVIAKFGVRWVIFNINRHRIYKKNLIQLKSLLYKYVIL